MARGKAPLTPAEKSKVFVKAGCIKLCKCLEAVLKPNIATYFLWSSVLYIGCGVWIYVSTGSIADFLCNVRPEHNVSTGAGLGCGNCSDNILLCGKGDAIQNAFNVTYQKEAMTSKGAYYQAFAQAAVDKICNELVVAASTVVNMVQSVQAADPQPATEGCKNFWCGVLKMVMIDTDLSSDNSTDPVCTNSLGAKRAWLADTCVCQADREQVEGDAADLLEYCNINLDPTPAPTKAPPTPKPSPTSKPTPKPAGSSPTPKPGQTSRRLEGDEQPEPPRRRRAAAADPRRRDGALSRRLEDVSDWLLGAVQDSRGRRRWEAEEAQADHSASSRALSDNAPTPSGGSAGLENDDFPEFDTTPFTPCNCYATCVRGVATRSVDCGAAQCKLPKPSEFLPCVCHHCANCSVQQNLFLLCITYLSQGLIAGIVFLCFAYFESKDELAREDGLVHIPYAMYPLGFFCKQLPPLVRVFILVNFVQIGLLLVSAFVPTEYLEYQPDCNSSNELKLCSGVTFCVWFFQVVAGRIAKLYTRKPPYLYSPERPGSIPPFKQMKQLLRALGP